MSLGAVVDVSSAGISAVAFVDVVVAGVLTCAVGGGVATLADRLVSDAADPCVADAVTGGVVGGLPSPLPDVISTSSAPDDVDSSRDSFDFCDFCDLFDF